MYQNYTQSFSEFSAASYFKSNLWGQILYFLRHYIYLMTLASSYFAGLVLMGFYS